MRFVTLSSITLVFILFLASCKTSLQEPSIGYRDGVKGNVDSTIIYSYSGWNNQQRKGEGLFSKQLICYTRSGNVASSESWALDDKKGWKKDKMAYYTYDEKNMKTKEVVEEYDVKTGVLSQLKTDILMEKTDSTEYWEKTYVEAKDTSVLVDLIKKKACVDNYYVVENGKESFYMFKEYTAKGQLENLRIRMMTIGMQSNFDYHPRWGFIDKEWSVRSFGFSELSIYTDKKYAYTELDAHKNWIHRVIYDSESKEKPIYQIQEVHYRK